MCEDTSQSLGVSPSRGFHFYGNRIREFTAGFDLTLLTREKMAACQQCLFLWPNLEYESDKVYILIYILYARSRREETQDEIYPSSIRM